MQRKVRSETTKNRIRANRLTKNSLMTNDYYSQPPQHKTCVGFISVIVDIHDKIYIYIMCYQSVS
jgi:hypothetical protein